MPVHWRTVYDVSMANSSKPVVKSAVKRAARSKPIATTKPAAKEPPYLRFYHSDELRTKTLAVLDALEKAPDPTKQRDDLAEVVVQLTNAGMDFFFIRSLKLAKAGFIIQQSANLGVAGGLQVIGSVIRNIIGRMDKPQLLSVCGSIRDLMR